MAANLPAAAAPAVTGRVFPGEAGQVRAARRFLAAMLDGCPAADDALLCVSELATNAVLHSRSGRPGGRFTVCVRVRAGSVRVAVADEGGPWGQRRGADGQSGRGLLIVGELATRWGREDSAAGRTVWFEIDWLVRDALSTTGSVTPQPPGRTPHSAGLRASGTTQPQAPLRCPGGEDTPPEASEAPAREAMKSARA